jgi:phenylpropionate dioxygenase-like ring-hydroxylating dioxygenase large terminal subunit
MSPFKSQSAFKSHRYREWYIACTAAELGHKAPIARSVLGLPLVLFRGHQGQPVALLDRCPHRNIPLSSGTLKRRSDGRSDQLACRYHGWEFDEQGHCQAIPGLCDFRSDPIRNATAYPAIEQQGHIWVYPSPEPPQALPYAFPAVDRPGYSTFRWQMATANSLENAAENFLDTAHTHFVHAGLIRTNARRRSVDVKITRYDRAVEAIYAGEEQISGLIYRLLAPGCGEVLTISRFLLPAIAQIEYQTDRDYRLFITLFITPVDAQRLRAYSVVTFRWGLPNWLGRVIAQPLFRQAMQQDLAVMRSQAENIDRFAGEQFVSTELDVMRPHIEYLLAKSTFAPSSADRPVMQTTIAIQL